MQQRNAVKISEHSMVLIRVASIIILVFVLDMTIDPLFEAFSRGLNSTRAHFKEDIARITESLQRSQAAIKTTTNPLELWTAGANIAAFAPSKSSDVRPAQVISIMKTLSSLSPVDARQPPSVQPTPLQNRKAVSFHPTVKSSTSTQDEIRVAETPSTACKVRGMLSVWEDKIQKVNTPHYGKTPLSTLREEPQLGTKRKQPLPASDTLPAIHENSAAIPEEQEASPMDITSDGPILEIPDDLLAELEGLDPVKREERLSLLCLEFEEKRKSESQGKLPEVSEPQLPITGRVAAALKLFTGTSVPKREFGIPVPITSKPVKLIQSAPNPIIDEAIDGVAIDPPHEKIPIKFYDVQEKGVIEIDFDDDEEQDAELSQIHAAEAAQAVAEEEAVKDELEKSAWLADIEEIKIVSTPAKHDSKEKSGDWSVVSQKMNLSCTLTPVVPGRRSCIAILPVKVPLGPKHVDDQYDVTDKDTDSENELSPNTRAKKKIPGWCTNWRQKTIAQVAVDPESIFGISMPKCDLDVIFTDRNYRKMGLQRPKRARGSSGNWTFDKLSQDEIDKYRAKLGQVVKAEGVFVEP
jgi:hypothetical protein